MGQGKRFPVAIGRFRQLCSATMCRSPHCALGLLLAACTGEVDDSASTPEPELDHLAPGDHLLEFGGVSTYVHVPPDSPSAPLIVFLHGTNGAGTWDGSAWQQPNPTKLAESSDELHFVLAVPGVSAGADDHDWSLNAASAAEIDAVIAGVETQTSVDPERAFVVGVSKGGGMASWYGLNHPGLAKGIAPISAGYTFGYPTTEPDPKLPFYIAHDPRDPQIAYTNAEQLAADLDAHGHAFELEDWELGQDGHGWNPDLPEPILGFLTDPG